MKILYLILFLTLNISILSQEISNWRNYSAMRVVNDITETSEGLWAATSGGAFFYNYNDSSFNELRKADGLNSSSLSAIEVDNSGKVWFGSNDGIIDVYNPADNSFKTILDIFNNTERSQKRINDFEVTGDTIIVSTDFGISLVDADEFIFLDTFSKFGSLPSFIKVNYAFKRNLVYAALVSGLAIQKQGSVNLTSPDSWNIYQTVNGLAADSISKITFLGESLIAATKAGLSRFNGTTWESFIPELNNLKITDILSVGEILYIIVQNQIYKYEGGSFSFLYPSAGSKKLFHSERVGLFAATDEGLIIFNNNSSYLLAPNGPLINQFPSVTVDNSGNLWSASGRDARGRGFYKYDGEMWTNYNMSNATLPTNDYIFVYAAPDNTIYLGSWGAGFAVLKNDELKVYDASNTDMIGTDENPDYIVITGFGTDSRSNTWILNYQSVSRQTLSMLTPDNELYNFTIPAQNIFLDVQHNLVVDQYDTKWYNSLAEGKRGIFYFNELKTYEEPDDDRSGFISGAQGLNNDVVNSMVVDNRGDIWVGTAFGVNIISNTNTILSQANPQLSIRSVFALRQQSVNCMAVDPLNQKWIGTNQGIHLVNADGTAILNTFDMSNSALLANEIRSIAVDKTNGIIYVGTDAGLTSFQTAGIMPNETLSDLFFYPSPFVINSGNLLTIEGLIRDSEIKILDINGNLITDFITPGGRRAFWNGTDSNGEPVSTGVYFIVAFDANGDNVATGKVAVFRE